MECKILHESVPIFFIQNIINSSSKIKITKSLSIPAERLVDQTFVVCWQGQHWQMAEMSSIKYLATIPNGFSKKFITISFVTYQIVIQIR